MQVSDYSHIVYQTIKVSIAILVSALGVVWINQQPFNEYWMLHFHRETPWEDTDAHWWSYGATVGNALNSSEDNFLKVLSGEKDEPAPTAPPVMVKSADCSTLSLPRRSQMVTANNEPSGAQRQLPAAGNSPELISVLGPMKTSPEKVLLPAGKKVLMIGDSMMEGVAPQIISLLKKEHQIGGVNLSKRSTGLAYPSFFNWPKTTENTLVREPDIGLLIVFLGPNDPWDMPSERNRHFLKFKSAEWESEYRQRIERILTSAQQRNIPVIWALPPVMRKSKLNAGVSYLDTLYASEVSSSGGMTVDVNTLFGYKDNHYSPNAVINGKKLRVRADDGIHYSPEGQRLIARAILTKIQFPEKNKE
ncbi:SGNH family hydrolase [Citrobacter werkmanii]|uniref:SGNH/GDSL hydrolase family protein n=1 Tax=Citrobacter werkmanii TaxID=67827 RepID=UPI00271DCD87|nr:SGNH family hydrolase [Citrobacter werkmanii]MDO8232933.1 SGNH family hydrolase [Citrobacter werkmanii]